MPKRKTTEQFIEESKKVHGDKYDYSKVEYVNARTKVCVICPEHGEFWQIPDSHLHGRGCRKCGRNIVAQKLEKWSEKQCYDAALECKTVGEFKKKYNAAYVIASRKGWRNGYFWLTSKQKPKGYWHNFEHCKEAAEKCSSAGEFHELYGNAHAYCMKMGWLDKLFPDRQKKLHWTDELALEEAKKYSNKMEFKHGNKNAYNHVCKNNLMKICTWFTRPTTDNHLLVQEYINKCIKKFDGFYDYSLIDINNVRSVSHTKVDIVCPEHGTFQQNLWAHLNCVCPCPKCRRGISIKVAKGNRIQTFIQDKVEHGIIYCYTNKQNGKKYVGQTIRPQKRQKDHLRKGQKRKIIFDKILQKHGEENFTYEILFEVNAKRSEIAKILNEKEKQYIKEFNCLVPNGYNISEGGKSIKFMSGWKPTPEQRQQLSEAHKGIPSSMKGKHYSEDKRQAMADKRRETMQQKYADGYIAQRKAIRVYRIIDGKAEFVATYPNAKEIERQLGVDYKRIHYALSKNAPLDNNLIFAYERDFSEDKLKEAMETPSCKRGINRVNRLTNESFKRRAIEIHGDKYDYKYTNVEHRDKGGKVCIICPKHGAFKQSPSQHLSGHGCYLCGRETVGDKMRDDTAGFIQRANVIHRGKYDYSLSVYVNGREPVRIVCPEHGEFTQIPEVHLRGCGCPTCASVASADKRKLWTRETIHQEAQKYQRQVDFRHGSGGAYGVAQRMGMLSELQQYWTQIRHAPNYWQYNTCKEAASTCGSRGEYKKQYGGAYRKACTEGWLDEFFPK